MSELVADCPRCGANKITFNLISAITTRVEYGWQQWYDAFCICRHCSRSTIFVLADSVDADYNAFQKVGITKFDGSVNRYIKIRGVISNKDKIANPPPDFIPSEIEAVFREAATCLAVDCNNASGTMFRLCIDLTTRALLPEGEHDGLNYRKRRDLGLRLPWLFKNNLLPKLLKKFLHACEKMGMMAPIKEL